VPVVCSCSLVEPSITIAQSFPLYGMSLASRRSHVRSVWVPACDRLLTLNRESGGGYWPSSAQRVAKSGCRHEIYRHGKAGGLLRTPTLLGWPACASSVRLAAVDRSASSTLLVSCNQCTCAARLLNAPSLDSSAASDEVAASGELQQPVARAPLHAQLAHLWTRVNHRWNDAPYS
jgi:hypothetical protein